MTVKEYLDKIGCREYQDITFVRAVRHMEGSWKTFAYISTPIHSYHDWKDHEKSMNRIVLNTKQNVVSWLSGANWNPRINTGSIISLAVADMEDLLWVYGDHVKHTIEYIDSVINDQIKAKNYGK